MNVPSNPDRRIGDTEQLERELEALLNRLRQERIDRHHSATRVATPAVRWETRPLFVDDNHHHMELVRKYIKARAARARLLPGNLFADPAWDILLMLYLHALEGRETIAKHACSAAGVPSTTSLRYLKILEQRGHIVRKRGHFDQRTAILTLTPQARAVMETWVEDSLAGLAKLSPGDRQPY